MDSTSKDAVEDSKESKCENEVTDKMGACCKPGVLRKSLVLVAAFVCQLVSLGFAFSLGVFFVAFIEAFPEVGRGTVSWATSLCSGVLFGAGIVIGPVVHKIGPRLSTILGGLIACVGLIVVAFVKTSLPILFVFFGFETGAGLCLIQLSSAVAIGQHYGKGRAAATSIAAVGAGVGSLSFPVILRFLIDEFGWKGAVLIFSAVLLNVCPLGMLFVPINDKRSVNNEEVEDINEDKENISPEPVEESKVTHAPNSPNEYVNGELLDNDSLKKKRFLCCTRNGSAKKILTNSIYIVYLIICPIISTGYSFPYVTLVDLGLLQNVDLQRSTLLLTYISIATATSTFLAGLILKFLHRQSILVFTVSLILMSVILFVFPSLSSYGALVGGAVMYGTAMGGITGTYAVVVADMLGLGLYAMGFGFVCTGYGIGYLLGTPVAGWITDLTGSYDTAYYIAGSLCLGSSILFVFTQIINRFCCQKKKSFDL